MSNFKEWSFFVFLNSPEGQRVMYTDDPRLRCPQMYLPASHVPKGLQIK